MQGNLIGKKKRKIFINKNSKNRRCPWLSSKTPTSTNFTDIERSIHNELLSSTSIADEKHANKPPAVTVTPAPMKSFVRRREPETGGKTNVFNIDEEELAENDYTSNKETMVRMKLNLKTSKLFTGGINKDCPASRFCPTKSGISHNLRINAFCKRRCSNCTG